MLADMFDLYKLKQPLVDQKNAAARRTYYSCTHGTTLTSYSFIIDLKMELNLLNGQAP